MDVTLLNGLFEHSVIKAAASEEASRRLRYVELLSDETCLREAIRRRQGTPPEDYFSILLGLVR